MTHSKYICTSSSVGRILLTVLCMCLSLSSFAQIKYPFTLNASVRQPSVFISDLYSPGSNKMNLSLIFNDLNEPSWDVRFKITIDGGAVKLVTKASFSPPALNVSSGVLYNIRGEELAPYFEYANMDIQGISIQELSKNGRLPEGFYQFCFEVIDYKSGKTISNVSCASAYLQLNDPPILQLPICGSVIRPSNPQNILFRWQLINSLATLSNSFIDYTFQLYEITDPSIDPQTAILNNRALKIFEQTSITSTSLLYDLQAPPLEVGKKYAYQVVAYDGGGRDIFKNKGVSQICWFYYGYPAGASIPLFTPENNKAFTNTDQKLFRWGAPSNSVNGQLVSYQLRIIKLENNTSYADFSSTFEPFYQYTSPPVPATSGGEFMLPKNLEPMTNYAWQVTAISDMQEIGKSEIKYFKGQGIIDYFMAGKYRVNVVTTSNSDLNSLSGRARVFINEDSQFVECDFQSLRIVEENNIHFLQGGEIQTNLNDIMRVRLIAKLADNGDATLKATSVRISKNEFKIYGEIEWLLPHAVSKGNAAIRAEKMWYNYQQFKVSGNAYTEKRHDFELLDPMGVILSVAEKSEINVTAGIVDFNFNGKILYRVWRYRTDELSRLYTASFNKLNNLFYFENLIVKNDTNLLLFPNSETEIIPLKLTVDLSETKSPVFYNSNLFWKGIYLNQYYIKIPADADRSNQLLLMDDLFIEQYGDASGKTLCSVSSTGLNLSIDKEYGEALIRCKFNKFGAKIASIHMHCNDGIFSDSYIKGSIMIPILSLTDWYAFKINLSENGFDHGDLTQSLQGITTRIGQENTPNYCELYIKEARFSFANKVDLTIDVYFPQLNTRINNVSGLNVWGNSSIGFGAPNKALFIPDFANGKIDQLYGIQTDSLTIAYHPADFDIATSTRIPPSYGVMLSYYIDLGDDITGVSGRPKAATAAIMPMKVLEQPIRSDEASIKVNGYNTDEQEKINNQTDKKGAAFIKEMLTRKGNTSTLFIHHPSLKLYTNSLNAKGEFEYVSHPTLGKCFFATSSVQVRMPFAFSTYAPILIGKSNDRTFWIVELNSSGNTNTESDALSAWQSFTASTYLSEFTAEAKNMLTVKTISIQTKKPIHIKPLSQEVISGSLKIKGLQGYLYKNVSLQNDKNSFTKSEDDLYRGTLLLEMNDIGSNGKDVGIAALAECSNTNSTIHLLNMTACMEIGNEETPFAETNQQAFKAGGNLVFNTLTGMIFGDVYSQSQNISLCTKGNMSIQITPSGYLFTLGNADKLVKISPGCLGVPFNGWIDIEKGRTNFHLALQRSVRFDSDSENLGVCSQVLYGDVGLKFEANFSLPLKTRFQYDGKFSTETQSSIDLTSEYSGNGCTLSPIQVGMFDVIGKSHLTFENNSIAITGQLVATTKINGVMQQIGIHCNKIISRID